MAAIAAFATSDKGRFYAQVCEKYGIDPAADLEDDVVAFNLRAALLVASQPEKDEPTVIPFADHVEVKGLDPFGDQ